jgi:dihydrofolate reductase
MSKPLVFLIASISADGYIARTTDHFADWSSKEDKQLFVQLTKEAGVMVMGSTTFNLFPKPLPGRKHVVYTRSLNQKPQENVTYTTKKPADIVAELAKEGFEKIAIIGGQKIYDLFLQSRVADEVYLVVEPFLFGDGIKFIHSQTDQTLELIESKSLNKNTVMLHYKVIK